MFLSRYLFSASFKASTEPGKERAIIRNKGRESAIYVLAEVLTKPQVSGSVTQCAVVHGLIDAEILRNRNGTIMVIQIVACYLAIATDVFK